MKNTCVLLIIAVLLIFSLTGCLMFDGADYKWNFDYEPKDIVKIQIVNEVEYNSHTVLKDIDPSLYDTIYAEIEAINWGTYWGDLSEPKGTCFLITFNTGDYDIISFKAPTHVRFENQRYGHYISFYCCDQEEFAALINKYLN